MLYSGPLRLITHVHCIMINQIYGAEVLVIKNMVLVYDVLRINMNHEREMAKERTSFKTELVTITMKKVI